MEFVTPAFRAILNFFLWIFVLLPTLLVYAPFRAFSRLWVCCVHGWKPVEGLGAMLYMRSDNACCTIVLHMIVDADYSTEYLNCVQSRFLKYFQHPASLPFQAVPTLVLGQLYWKPVNVDINHHVRIADGINTGRMYQPSEAIDIATVMVKNGFEPGRPLWDLVVVPKIMLDGDAKFSIFLRFHHAMSDGATMLSVLSQYIFESAKTYRMKVQSLTPSSWMILRALFTLPLFSLPKLYSRIVLGTKLPSLTYDSVYHTTSINMKLITFIKKKAKINFSDVIHSSACAALCYHFRQYELGTIPYAIPYAVPAYAQDAVSNSISILYFPVVQGIIEDPLEHLRATTPVLSHWRHRTLELYQFHLLSHHIVPHLPYFLVQFIAQHNNMAAILSNLPGPRKHWKLCNNRISSMSLASVVLDLAGVSILLLGYVDKLAITVHVDKGILNDGEHAEDIGQAVVEYIEILADKLGYNTKYCRPKSFFSDTVDVE